MTSRSRPRKKTPASPQPKRETGIFLKITPEELKELIGSFKDSDTRLRRGLEIEGNVLSRIRLQHPRAPALPDDLNDVDAITRIATLATLDKLTQLIDSDNCPFPRDIPCPAELDCEHCCIQSLRTAAQEPHP